jgi:drug/metabolite transporter (DMT)-like permease
MTREREGLLPCLVSAAGFGAMPIFAKEAYADGLAITPLLALRFAIAAAMLWALIALARRDEAVVPDAVGEQPRRGAAVLGLEAAAVDHRVPLAAAQR